MAQRASSVARRVSRVAVVIASRVAVVSASRIVAVMPDAVALVTRFCIQLL